LPTSRPIQLSIPCTVPSIPSTDELRLEGLPAPQTPAAVAPPDLTDLENQARYHRDRLALYRAKMHGPKATSVGRLEALQRAATAAQERLDAARHRSER
jgi:hypothetical protein